LPVTVAGNKDYRPFRGWIFDLPASAPVMMSGCTSALTIASARWRSHALVPVFRICPAVLRAKTEQCTAAHNARPTIRRANTTAEGIAERIRCKIGTSPTGFADRWHLPLKGFSELACLIPSQARMQALRGCIKTHRPGHNGRMRGRATCGAPIPGTEQPKARTTERVFATAGASLDRRSTARRTPTSW
jgi:hypothetical protein